MSVFKQALLLCSLLLASGNTFAQNWVNHTTSDDTTVVKRHEAGFATSGNKLYVLGGRGNKPVQVFDATQNRVLGTHRLSPPQGSPPAGGSNRAVPPALHLLYIHTYASVAPISVASDGTRIQLN